MLEKTKLKVMFYFTVVYLVLFTIRAIYNSNYEFLYYTFILSILIFIVVIYYQKIHLTTNLIAGLVLVGAMHVLGGNISLFGTRLYELWFLKGVLRYDNVVHFIGSYVATLVAYNFLYPHLDSRRKHHKLWLSIVIILMAMGVGVFNEILELIAVVMFDASQQVGDYFNNAVDLVYNFLGAATSCAILINYKVRKNR
ncbi:DUF2238 domain-containing protein [Candidatus Woesearchaeota archaeon]|nr:DUF2238 domain-containing protein [Candidatus Woesearchaeota archaeon]